MKISVTIPSRGRPKQLIETLNQWHHAARKPELIEYLVNVDRDDETINTEEFGAGIWNIPNCHALLGNNTTKQEAVNANLDIPKGDIIFHICDDVLCTCVGWDEMIRADMQAHFPDLDGVLHYPDGIQNERLCTHPVIGRKYLQRFGYISSPAYKSFFADNEFTEVARHLGKIKYIDVNLFEHDHPMLGRRKADALNERDALNYASDEAIYIARKAKGFDGIMTPSAPVQKPQVLIAVLSRGEWKAEMAGCVCGMLLVSPHNYANDYFLVGILDERCTIIGCGRNHVIQQALTFKHVTHVLFIDADATFPVNTLKTLLDHKKDVIACRALRRMPPYTPTGQKLPDGKWIIGCHVMLVKLSIFAKLKFPWFEGGYNDDGTYTSEDQHFCKLVNEVSAVDCDEELSKHIGHLGDMNFKMELVQEEAAP